ncbi:MAG TPA: hypothetical protein VM734_09555 [Kofleriaceae bacterium]|nr:hypothetical protein [Kofleriaceae bacterium]
MPGWNVFYGCALLGALAACASSKPGGVGGEVDAAGDDASDGDGGPTGDGGAPDDVLYVSVVGHDGNDGRSPAHPLRHIQFAIDRARACEPGPCRLWIAEGVYQEELLLAGGVDLEGGWAQSFAVRDLAIYPVVITSDAAVAVHAEVLDGPVVVDGLTIRGADLGDDDDGGSTIALRVRDAADHLKLRRVRVEGGRAARGRAGDDGSLVACDARGGEGGAAFDCGGGEGQRGNAGGDPYQGGAGGNPGASNCPSACPLVGSDGISAGTLGGNGANGTGGPSGSATTDDDGAFVDDLWQAGVATGGGRGGHGTGGSGGGPGGSKRFRACFGCGTLVGGRGGDGARGGCGGGGGGPGLPGGASFGIVVIRSTITFDSVLVAGGQGGPGGDGGDGHPGSPGGTDGTIGRQDAPSQQCGLITYRAGAGAPGGVGGHGGHGGGGGGGAGGPAIGVALINGEIALVGEPGTSTSTPGTGGLGGRGGTGADLAPAGPPGRVAEVVTY